MYTPPKLNTSSSSGLNKPINTFNTYQTSTLNNNNNSLNNNNFSPRKNEITNQQTFNQSTTFQPTETRRRSATIGSDPKPLPSPPIPNFAALAPKPVNSSTPPPKPSSPIPKTPPPMYDYFFKSSAYAN